MNILGVNSVFILLSESLIKKQQCLPEFHTIALTFSPLMSLQISVCIPQLQQANAAFFAKKNLNPKSQLPKLKYDNSLTGFLLLCCKVVVSFPSEKVRT
jgi:hypothetical protein